MDFLFLNVPESELQKNSLHSDLILYSFVFFSACVQILSV